MDDLLYAVNDSFQTIMSGDEVDFGNTVRLKGTAIAIERGKITIEEEGFYDIFLNVTVSTKTPGRVMVALYKEGTQIPGAVSTVTIHSFGTISVTIPTATRLKHDGERRLTCVVTTDAANKTLIIENASIFIKCNK